MPNLNTKLSEGLKLRIMLLGEAMLRKTWWAGAAAEAGFNVIYIDGDGNPQVLKNLSESARNRISYIDAVDTPNNSAFGFFLISLLSGQKFIWDEGAKQTISAALGTRALKPESSYMVFDPSKLTMNDIIVIDSWTALVRSFQRRYAKEQGIVIEESSSMDSDWSDYRWTGAIASKMVENLKLFPCHSIVIAHSERFEKKDDKGKVLSVRHKPISTSRTHADTLTKNFTDIIHFTLTGSNIFLDTKPNAEIVAGSRSVAPMRAEWDKLQFSHFAAACGVQSTGQPCEAVTFYGPGEYPGLQAGATQTQSTTQAASPAAAQGVINPKVGKVSLIGLGKRS
jgi:hypothetical protein